MNVVTPSSDRVRRRPRRTLLTAALSVLTVIGAAIGFSNPSTVSAVSDGDWLGVVNTYRAMSGLAPVTANGGWSGDAQAHSCYMLQNGITHDEIPGRPGYTPGGDIAGNSGNVAVSSSVSASARNHIDLWMTGPFHAIGILRSSLRSTGFGLCASSSTPTPWHSAGTLDVIRGLDDSAPKPTSPIVFPGDGATVPLHRFITEYPNPMTMCGWTGDAGLPLIAMMPNEVSTVTTTVTGPNGPVETCALHEGNTWSDATARAILGGENAVIVMPREVLADGTYTVTVNSDGGNVTWSFTVDRDAPLRATPPEPPDTPDTAATAAASAFEPVEPFRFADSRIGLGTVRLRAGKITRFDVGSADIAAVSANFAVVSPADYGYLTAYNCTAKRPVVSTLGYGPSQIVASQAIVPLDDGDMCLFSLADTDVVIDINGYYRNTTGGSGFVPVEPSRLLDTRVAGSTALRAGVEFPLRVAGVSGGAPSDADGIALNVTVVDPADHGYLQVYPCGVTSKVKISSLNYAPGDVRPNAAVTEIGDGGRICLRSLRDTHIVVDFTGYFGPDKGLDLLPLDPIRLFDSRSGFATLNESTGGRRVGAGEVVRLKIAGQRGVPASAKAVSVTLTATDALHATYVTLFPCGKRPNTANVNLRTTQPATGNGAMVKLSNDGELCIFSKSSVHLILDINGIWQ